MDLLSSYRQVKKEKTSGLESIVEMNLFEDGNVICYYGEFSFDYRRFGTKKRVTIYHTLNLNIKNGDFTTFYQLINKGEETEKLFKSRTKRGKNNFYELYNLISDGILKGEKRLGYWGVKHKRACQEILQILSNKIIPTFKTEFYSNKDYTNSIYELIVDLHLDRKNIKGFNSIYHSIQNDYPKLKWLKLNEYKFLPAVLDSYGIKSKYLIGEINKNSDKEINLKTLRYVCNLFGENYIDYLKQIDWIHHCFVNTSNKKIHTLRNESEKSNMVKLFNNWEKKELQTNSLIYSINELLSIREYLSDKIDDLKFKAKDDHSFELLHKQWESYKIHLKKGYRVRVGLPEDFIKDIEEDIIVDDLKFNIKLLKTEKDFTLEGYHMKNCMSQQFNTAQFYIYISMTHNKKCINLQYRRGKLTQSYGKANSSVDKLFNKTIQILNKKMEQYGDLEIKKEKFDFI
jgi:hypothetical protein